MKKRFFLPRNAAALLLALLTAAMVSCGAPPHDEAEIREALDVLLPLSYELNEIYFGEGLPATKDQARIDELYGTFAANVKSLKYHPVAEDCGYDSIADIKEATEAVFTDEYTAYLYELAFDGISSDKITAETEAEETELGDGEIIPSGGEVSGTYTGGVSLDVTASYARYLEQNGILTVRLDLADSAYSLGREYRTDEMEIVSNRDACVVVRIPTYLDGTYDQDVDLRLVLTDAGWRLDTPTY
ncbi:MAG: hypothetical protein ACI4V1_04835 [Eubacteriales bacterium]